MERRTVLVGVAAFFLAASLGFYISVQPAPEDRFTKEMNITLDSSSSHSTVRFANGSIDLMREDTSNAKFYLDVNRDGSFDRLVRTRSDGEEHVTTEIVTVDGKEYRLHFRYRDKPGERGDDWLNLYLVRALEP